MRWFVTGASGQLGSDLVTLMSRRRPRVDIFTPTSLEMDLGSGADIREELERVKPDVVVNCAAWTDVDQAESCEADVFRINSVGPYEIARVLHASGQALVIQVSTDYVFGDSSPGFHAEDAIPAPESVYGLSKLRGEVAVRSELPDRSMVVRTAWLYGVHGKNFAKTVARKVMLGEPIKVVNDQLGQPSWSVDVATRIIALVDGFQHGMVPAGTYHAVNAGAATWFQFAQEIVRLLGQDPELVTLISSDQLDRVARRPTDSRLGDAAAQACGLPPMRDWREALAKALPEIVRNL